MELYKLIIIVFFLNLIIGYGTQIMNPDVEFNDWLSTDNLIENMKSMTESGINTFGGEDLITERSTENFEGVGIISTTLLIGSILISILTTMLFGSFTSLYTIVGSAYATQSINTIFFLFAIGASIFVIFLYVLIGLKFYMIISGRGDQN